MRTEIVEVPVEVPVALDPALTREEPAPARPALRCVDARLRPTLCNSAMADWLLAYDAALARLNARMRQVLQLQPKGEADE